MFLHTMNVCCNLRSPKLTSNVTYPTGSSLLSLADESHKPVHDCILSALHNFSKQVLLITDLEVPWSQRVETLLLFITVWKSAVHMLFT